MPSGELRDDMIDELVGELDGAGLRRGQCRLRRGAHRTGRRRLANAGSTISASRFASRHGSAPRACSSVRAISRRDPTRRDRADGARASRGSRGRPRALRRSRDRAAPADPHGLREHAASGARDRRGGRRSTLRRLHGHLPGVARRRGARGGDRTRSSRLRRTRRSSRWPTRGRAAVAGGPSRARRRRLAARTGCSERSLPPATTAGSLSRSCRRSCGRATTTTSSNVAVSACARLSRKRSPRDPIASGSGGHCPGVQAARLVRGSQLKRAAARVRAASAHAARMARSMGLIPSPWVVGSKAWWSPWARCWSGRALAMWLSQSGFLELGSRTPEMA